MERRRTTASSGLTRRHKPDYQIVLFMGLLMLLGLIIMFAIGPQRAQFLNTAYGTDFYTGTYFFAKQAFSLVAAVIAFYAVSKIPYTWLQANAKRLVIIAFISCAVLAVAGWMSAPIAQCSLGACRWFSLGPLGGIQPAEFLKFALLLFIAGFLAVRVKAGVLNDSNKTLLPLAALLGAAALFVIVFQKDMGTGISLFAMAAAMLFVAGIDLRVGAIIALIAIVTFAVFVIIAPHRVERVSAFLAGESASTDDAATYHIAHAKIAIGTGGLLGVGIGNSVQATGYLPEVINDSVFAVMGETFGFIGLMVVLLLFGALLFRLLMVSDRLQGLPERLLVAGVFGWLGSHVILNIAAMTGVFPLTGITLPLLSFGGTSMVFIAGALGLAFQLSRYTNHASVQEGARYEDSRSRRGLGRSRDAGRGNYR